MVDTILINTFQVPAEREDDFLALWQRANQLLREAGAYRSTRLHRSLSPDDTIRYVNVADLASVDAWRATLARSTFRELSADMAAFSPGPGLFRVTHADSSDGRGHA